MSGLDFVLGSCQNLAPVKKALELEVRGLSPKVQAWVRDKRPQLKLSCDDDVIALQLSVDSCELGLSVADEPRGLVRRVSLAGAELIQACWDSDEPMEAPASVVTSRPRSSEISPNDVGVLSGNLPARSVAVLASVSRGGRPRWNQLGLHLAVSYELTSAISLMGDVAFEWGSVDVSLGKVTVREGLVGSFIVYRFWQLELGVGARGGIQYLKGEPSGEAVQGGSGAATWVGGAAMAQLGVPVGKSLRLLFRIDADAIVVPSRALVNSESEATQGHLRARANIGVAVRF